jgi:hypothetical protein
MVTACRGSEMRLCDSVGSSVTLKRQPGLQPSDLTDWAAVIPARHWSPSRMVPPVWPNGVSAVTGAGHLNVLASRVGLGLG